MRRSIVLLFVLFASFGLLVGCGLDESQMQEKTKSAARTTGNYTGPTISNPKGCYFWQRQRSCPNREDQETKIKTCPDGTTMTCTRTVSKKNGRLSPDHCLCLYDDVKIGDWDCPRECKTVVQTPDGNGGKGGGLRPW